MKKGAEALTAGKKFAELAVEFPLMLLMCMSMVYPFAAALEFGLSFLTIFLTVAFFLALWTAVLFNRWTMLGSLALAIVIGAVVYFTSFARTPLATAAFRYKLDEFLQWAGMYLRGYRSANLQYAAILIAIFSAVICLTVCVFTFKQFDLVTVLLAGAACYVALVVIGHIVNIPSLFCYILAATLYIILNSYKKNAREMAVNHSISLPMHMVSALPLAAVVLASTILLSGMLKIDPTWMKDVRDRLLKKTDTLTKEVIKASAKTQITSDELGGNMYLSDDVVMEVASPVSNLHLRAQSKSFYTGHSWFRTDTDQNDFAAASLDDTNLTEAFIQNDPDVRGKLFQRQSISVKYISFNTGIVYAPLKLTSLRADDAAIRLIGGDMLMLNQNSDDLTYTLKYYQPAYHNAVLADLLRSAGGDSSTGENNNDFFSLRKEYTQLPDELPQRVQDLADRLTQGKTNDYDKAVAVETYLRNNFAYTLTPGSSDLNRDFVDQFLFEGRKGYCTYFATAMAVLLRCENIPARYVEGYVLPSQADDGVYKVTRKQGHAWTEVYFKGVGWMTFEPTASFASDYPASGAATPAPQPTPSPTVNPHPTATSPDTAVSKPDNHTGKPQPVNLILPVLLLAFVALSFILAAIPYRSRLSMRKMTPRDSAVLLFGQYLRLLAVLGETPRSEDGMAAFSKWIEKQYALPNAGFFGALDIFQQARFSQHEITSEQKDTMLAFRRQLLTACKKQLGIMRYLFFRYIWGI